MTLWGCFGPPSCCFSYIKSPKHPLKMSYSKCLRQTQIGWVIWRSSSSFVKNLWVFFVSKSCFLIGGKRIIFYTRRNCNTFEKGTEKAHQRFQHKLSDAIGSFLLTMELFCTYRCVFGSFFAYILGAFLLTAGAFCLHLKLFCLQLAKVHLISTLTGALLNSTWNYNSHETTTFECPTLTHRGPNV